MRFLTYGLMLSLTGYSYGVFAELLETRELLRETLPITANNHFDKKVVLSIGPIVTRKGELIDVRFQIETTNEYNYNLMIGREVRLSKSRRSLGGQSLIPGIANNVTPAMHHGVHSASKVVETAGSFQSVYINLIMWSASTGRTINDKVALENTGAFLQVTR